MKCLKHRRNKPLEGEITICWVEEGLSFVQWRPRAGRVRVCRESLFLEAALVSPRTYRESLASISGAQGKGNFEVSWAVLEEAFPYRDASTGDEREMQVDLPEWIECCWRGLEVNEIPKTILSGLRILEKELSRWPDYEQSGTGACMQIGQRILFLGHGNGTSIHRLSRKGLVVQSDQTQVTREWLLQTRLLFRNRTAAQLRRVHIPGGRECLFSQEGDEPFEIIPGLRPPAWVSAGNCHLEIGLLFIHSSVFKGLGDPGCRLSFPQLERRRRSRAWDRRLRMGSCLLLGGWSFLLLGACRQDVMAVPETRAAGEIESFRAEVSGLEKKWRAQRSLESGRQKPYRLVGAISDSVPEGIEVNRIQIKKQSAGQATHLNLHVEGGFEAGKQTQEFRRWVNHLENSITGEKLKNLRFDRREDRILFSLQGEVLNGETPR